MDEAPCYAMSLVGGHHMLREIVENMGHCWVRVQTPFLHVQFTKRLVTEAVLLRYGAIAVVKAYFVVPWHTVLRDCYLTPDEPARALWEHCKIKWLAKCLAKGDRIHTKTFIAQVPINYWTKRAVARSLEHHGVGTWQFAASGSVVGGKSVHTVAELPESPCGKLTCKLFLD